MKIGFLTFEQFHRKANIGSSRIRCDWVLKHMDGAERFHMGRPYDVVIYQKAYFVEHAKLFKGIKILDLCDADWLSWGYDIRAMIDEVDAITCSTQAIAEFIVNVRPELPVWVIPDRIDFSQEMPQKEHIGDTKKVVWFGYQHNQEQLVYVLPALIRRKLELIVISNKPYIVPATGKNLEITNLPWSQEHWKNDILKGDVAICPNDKRGRFKYKSDNKITQSWALGMPVCAIDKDLDRFAGEKERKDEARRNLEIVHKNFDVKDSAKEYEKLIKTLI
jgi:hypothetical protein